MEQNVFITGAGSLGEAFIRLLHKEHKLTVVDSNEWTIARLKDTYPDVRFILGDFAEGHITPLIDSVIHTAAYKHLPLGEENPCAFIENNITKLGRLFKEASRAKVNLLFISSDKAVEPISLYGYTKAIGEQLAEHYGFSIARLGNILDSSGSVIPVWEDCIEREVPVKVTDERMTRYFIEDMDAANQLWHEFIKGKKLIIPKCAHVRILDLLATVLERHGYAKVSDYTPGVEVIGIRDREKLEEKLKWEREEAV